MLAAELAHEFFRILWRIDYKVFSTVQHVLQHGRVREGLDQKAHLRICDYEVDHRELRRVNVVGSFGQVVDAGDDGAALVNLDERLGIDHAIRPRTEGCSDAKQRALTVLID